MCSASLGRWLFLKLVISRSVAQSEIAAMRLVRAHTSIPVPRAWTRFNWFGDEYILMSRMPGVDLHSVWDRLSDDDRDRVVDQLAPFTAQLRAIPSTHGPSNICAANGGPVHDHRLPAKHRGPFPDEAAFNYVLRYFEPLENLPAAVIAAQERTHPVVFTHGDIMPRNILVDGTRVTALLDWDAAGWFPAHWEYRKARWTVTGPLESSWTPRIPRFVPAYPVEADADDYLSRRFWSPS